MKDETKLEKIDGSNMKKRSKKYINKLSWNTSVHNEANPDITRVYNILK